ncbi:MAG: hypothetical protein ACR2OZ_05775 [Verrucomicrobiales bacterium]
MQPDAQQREVVIKTEEAAKSQIRARQQQKHLAALTVGGVILAIAAIAWLVVVGLAAPREKYSQAPAAPRFSPAEERTLKQRLDAAFVVASRALASEDWTSALPYLLRGERIEPLIERYHRQHRWTHLVLTRRHHSRLVSHEGVSAAEIEAETVNGRRVHLRLEETRDGWKLDWEALFNAPRFEWREFYTLRPAHPRRLRVTVLRASLPDAYYRAAGCPPAETLAVRLWGTEPGDSVVALVPAASELGQTLTADVSWEVPRQYLAEIRFADPNAVPPRVNCIDLLQKGWFLRE